MIDPETSQLIQKQMLWKMHYYRQMLIDVLGHIEGTNKITASEIQWMIKRELSINPKWEVLENLPHGIPMCQDPNIYKEVGEE